MAFIVRRRKSELDFKFNIVANSQSTTLNTSIKIGDALIPGAISHNFAVQGANNTTGDILGFVASIVQLQHIIELQGTTVTSTNETAGSSAYWVNWEPIDNVAEFEADIDVAYGTTTGSGYMGNFALTTTDAGVLSESSFVVYTTKSAKQFFSFGGVVGSTTKVRGRPIATLIA